MVSPPIVMYPIAEVKQTSRQQKLTTKTLILTLSLFSKSFLTQKFRLSPSRSIYPLNLNRLICDFTVQKTLKVYFSLSYIQHNIPLADTLKAPMFIELISTGIVSKQIYFLALFSAFKFVKQQASYSFDFNFGIRR